MDPKRTQKFDLGNTKQDTAEPDLEDILIEFSADPVREVATADTIPMDPVAPDAPEILPEAPAPETPEPPVEPFSEDWEPEYDAPMGEFTPPEPIQFPQSRLRTLRKKLVNGPERRFYALQELGLGKLKLALLVHVLLLSVSVALTVVHELGMIPEQRLQPVIFLQLLLAMLAVLTGCYRLLDGVGALLQGRFTLELLLTVSVLAWAVDGVFCLQSGRMPHSALICLQLLLAQWSVYQRRNTELCQMDTLRKATELDALVKIEDFLEGRPGYTTVPGEPESFLEHYETPSRPEKLINLMGLLGLAFSLVLGVVTGLSYGMTSGVQALSGGLLLCLPATALISMSRPAAIAERRLHRLGAVLCGWNGIRHAHKQAAYPLEYNDLLPDGSLKMNGVRFYGSADPGRVVAVTAALLEADGKGLTALFAQLPRSRSKAGFTVQDFAGHNGGISGTVNGQQVLFGTAEFMQEQDLALPDVGNVEFALYAALDGQVSAVFVLSCRRSRTAAAGLRMLSSDRNVVPVLTACDFLLTPKFLRTQLGMSAKRLYLLPRQQREILAQQQPADDAPVIALVTKTNLAARAGALNSARGLCSALRTGAMIHILGGLVGLLAVTVLSLIGAQDLLTPSNLLVYQALWSLPGLLITEWVRY